MAVSNEVIAESFSLLAKLMDIHGENSFKTKSYSNAAFTIEKLPESLQDLPPEKIFSIKGIGDAIGKKIQDIIQTGELRLLREYIDKTPPGIIELLKIKGLGPKKIATIWKEMEIETMGELLYACQENRLLLYKGFGEKTQTNLLEGIERKRQYAAKHRLGDALTAALMSAGTSLLGDTQFTEMYAMDFPRDAFLMSHMGEGNWAFARDDRPVKLIKRPLGIGGLDDPPTFLFQYRAGAATLATLVALGGEHFRLLVSEGEVLDTGELPGLEMPYGFFRPDSGLRSCADAWKTCCAGTNNPMKCWIIRARPR